jgi:hypothetical protein
MKSALFLSAACLAAILAACAPANVDPQTPEDIAASTAAAPPPPAAEPAPPPVSGEVLTAEGWGALKIGMTKDEVTAALGADAKPNAAGGPDEEACNEYRPERAPEGLRVMLEKGKLTRISLAAPSTLKTDKGLGVGDEAAAVKTAYGADAKVSPHKYQAAPAEYITVWKGGLRAEPYVQDETARGITYAVAESGKVEAVHAGGPSIQYVEGCS